MKIRDREFKCFASGLLIGFVCCYFLAGSDSPPTRSASPSVVAPISASTQAFAQPPMIWLITGQVHVTQPLMPVVRHASLEETLDELNRTDLIDFRYRPEFDLKDLR